MNWKDGTLLGKVEPNWFYFPSVDIRRPTGAVIDSDSVLGGKAGHPLPSTAMPGSTGNKRLTWPYSATDMPFSTRARFSVSVAGVHNPRQSRIFCYRRREKGENPTNSSHGVSPCNWNCTWQPKLLKSVMYKVDGRYAARAASRISWVLPPSNMQLDLPVREEMRVTLKSDS